MSACGSEASWAPYFGIVPGLGLQLFSGELVELVELPGDLGFTREVAAALTLLIGSREPACVRPEATQAAEEALQLFFARGGRLLTDNSAPGWPCFDDASGSHDVEHNFDFRNFHESPMGAGPTHPVTAASSVVPHLERLGFELALREPKTEIRALAWNAPIPIYEVRRAACPSEVIAEGKGLDEARSIESALGEAVERILGTIPSDSARLIRASADDLGVSRPAFSGLGLGPRDLLSPAMLTDWVIGYAWDAVAQAVPLPAELIYTDYISSTRVAAVTYRNTTGLASGRSLAEAVLNGTLEVIERDAYWTTMRCRLRGPAVDVDQVAGLDSRVLPLLAKLSNEGLRLHLLDMSLDWPVPVVHALLEDTNQRSPAFSHGSGAALTLGSAATRAICEAVQVRTDLCKLVANELQQYTMPEAALPAPHHVWSDPLWGDRLRHLHGDRSLVPRFLSTPAGTVAERVEAFRRALLSAGHQVLFVPLGEIGGLVTVRVIVTNVTPPDPRAERSSLRLERFLRKQGLPMPFLDPILS